jgi:predicted MPP superfamily phosphohydrolase
MAVSSAVKSSALAAAGSAALAVGYATLIERNAFVVREVTMPVLTPGSTPLRVLHLSDIHMRPTQRHKQAWLRELARWEPDLVVNTGDNLSHPKAVPAVVQSIGDLMSFPGVFVFGSNDYFAPRLKNPLKYLTDPDHRVIGKPLPWQDLRAAFTERGWLDLTHTRREVEVAGLTIAAAGVDDGHLGRDRYDTIAGPPNPTANLSLGVTHAPYTRSGVPALLRCAGHQLRSGPHTGQGGIALGCGHRPARLGGHRHVAVRPVPVLLPARGHPADTCRRTDGRPRREPERGAVQPDRVDALTAGEHERRCP